MFLLLRSGLTVANAFHEDAHLVYKVALGLGTEQNPNSLTVTVSVKGKGKLAIIFLDKVALTQSTERKKMDWMFKRLHNAGEIEARNPTWPVPIDLEPLSRRNGKNTQENEACVSLAGALKHYMLRKNLKDA